MLESAFFSNSSKEVHILKPILVPSVGIPAVMQMLVAGLVSKLKDHPLKGCAAQLGSGCCYMSQYFVRNHDLFPPQVRGLATVSTVY
jgi:hypothetical protein